MCKRLLCLVALLAACGQDPQAKGDQWVIIIPDDDMGVDETPDVAPDVPVIEPDMPATVADAPKANVYPMDPATDRGITSVVELPRPTSDEGNLTNEYVEVRNCREEMGQELNFMGFTAGYLCLEEQIARPGAGGDYLEITPPSTDTAIADPFAEIMMYYHVNRIHDYFKDVLGVTALDYPLPAITNLKIYVDQLAAGFLGIPAGWIPFDNAAFIPAEAFAQFMLPDRDEGTIVFGQGSRVDFSYDASVIYHEYTHAVIGTDRLNGEFADKYGMNNTPGAVNEAVADYFATSLREDPILGPYGLAGFGSSFTRNLSEKRTCPEHLTTEIHADGEIIGSMLWAMRAEVGADILDPMLFGALANVTRDTGFTRFVATLLSEAETSLDPDVADKLSGIARDWGLLGCDRAKPWGAFQVDQQTNPVPLGFPGTQQGGAVGFREWVPGYTQFSVEIPDGKFARISWTMSSQGGGFPGQGGGPTKLDAVLRSEGPVEFSFEGGSAGHNGTLEVDPAYTMGSTSRQQLEISSDCASPQGTVYLALRNRGQGAVSVNQTTIELVDAPAGPATTCAEVPMD